MPLLLAALYLPCSVELDIGDRPPPRDGENNADARRMPLMRPLSEREQKTNDDEGPPLPFDFTHIPRTPKVEPSVGTSLHKGIVDTRRENPTDAVSVNTVLSSARKKHSVPERTDEALPVSARRIRTLSSTADELRLAKAFNSSTGPKGRRRRASIWKSGGASWSIISQPGGNGGLYNAVNQASENGIIDGQHWVGLLGIATDNLGPVVRANIASSLEHRDCSVVYVSDAEFEGHYLNYCKEFLWPTFHALAPDIPRSKVYEDSSWSYYKAVNRAIADSLVDSYREGDTIWVHDYHLMLVPAMVRERLPTAPIGFFMHVSFPTSEVFRCLAYRVEILEGLLGANCIGFQNSEYAQHFMITAARILAVDTSGPWIQTPDRNVRIVACPIGIDPTRLSSILNSTAVQQQRQAIRKRWPNVKLIGGRDKANSIRGLTQKLQAYDIFLSKHPAWASKAVLIQVCMSSGVGNDYEAQVAALADGINSKYGDLAAGIQPVVLLRQDIVTDQYVALLAEADAFAITSLREGMNLTCHEYIYCNDPTRMGQVVLSEFTGSAEVLGDDVVLVNPYDRKRLADAFHEVLTMKEDVRRERSEYLRKIVCGHTGESWVRESVSSIQSAWEDDVAHLARKPDIGKLAASYRANSEMQRLIYFDITPQACEPAPSGPTSVSSDEAEASPEPLRQPMASITGPSYYSSRLMFVLHRLLDDPKNLVYVGSAESEAYMERVFRQFPTLGLVAESGKCIRFADSDQKWKMATSAKDGEWRHRIKPLTDMMRERLPVREYHVHESKIVFEFEPNMLDHDRVRSMIGEHVALIDDTFSNHGVRCWLNGNELTIYPADLTQLQVLAQEQIFEKHGQVGFTLLARHPMATDEDDLIHSDLERLHANKEVLDPHTILMGQHPTLAQSTVEGINSFLTLLESISQNYTRP